MTKIKQMIVKKILYNRNFMNVGHMLNLLMLTCWFRKRFRLSSHFRNI